MAHPCFYCGSECYCCGDIDDCVVPLTPKRCESCGCEDDRDDERDDGDDDAWPEDEEDDDLIDSDAVFACDDCGQHFSYRPTDGLCPKCAGDIDRLF